MRDCEPSHAPTRADKETAGVKLEEAHENIANLRNQLNVARFGKKIKQTDSSEVAFTAVLEKCIGTAPKNAQIQQIRGDHQRKEPCNLL